MGIRIEYDKQDQIVIAANHGKSSINDRIELVNQAVAAGQKYNCLKILFDMQNTEETSTFIEDYEFNQKLTQVTDLTHAHRCAVVFHPLGDKDRVLFYETVGSNWGQGIFKVFFDVKEGIKWLK